jgi:hypothetical protein
MRGAFREGNSRDKFKRAKKIAPAWNETPAVALAILQ